LLLEVARALFSSSSRLLKSAGYNS
jgi:hypothetical protein